MTYVTRIAANNHGGVYDNWGHPNRITLKAMPWEVEAEALPTLPKAREQYAPSVKTPTVAKPRAPSPCRFSEWDEGLLAEEWAEMARTEGHMRGVPMSAAFGRDSGSAGGKAKKTDTTVMRAVLRHLMHGDDTQAGIRTAIRAQRGGGYSLQLLRAEECGWIKKYRGPDGWRYSLKGAGYHAFSKMEREA